MSEQEVREIAYRVWHDAMTAFRLYPDNKHTFVKYWEDTKDLLVPSSPPEAVEKTILERIAEMTNFEGGGDMYCSDDPHGCLETISNMVKGFRK